MKKKKTVENAIKDLEEALKGDDVEAIKAKNEALAKASQSIAMKAYEKANKSNESDANGATDADDNKDDAVEAEFTEKQ